MIPWPQIHDFLVEVGSEYNTEQFLSRLYERIGILVPCDIPTYSLASSAVLVKEIYGVSKVERDLFLDYYQRLVPAETIKMTPLTVNWENYRHTEFVTDWMRPVGIKNSIGIILMKGTPDHLIQIAIHRSWTSSHFDENAMNIMRVLAPHLNNIYHYLNMIDGLRAENIKAAELAAGCKILSKRESEVAVLLCKRLTIAQISTLLFVSPRTVEKHIANIYEKLKVENRQELLLKLINIPS